ncbi:MAG: Xaa-Pro peptidase family protein [Patescibacteria group bacterium]|nr:Xaa-Pro peptidase family protein [Patescibacteria group bacterium]
MNFFDYFKKFLLSQSLDGFLVSNFYNVFYTSGFRGLAPEERESWVFILKDEILLFTDKRYEGKIIKNKSIKKIIYEEGKNIFDYLKNIVLEKNIKRVGFEAEDLKFGEYNNFISNLKIDLVPYYFLIKKYRAKKTEEEIELIQKACQIADECLTEVKKNIKPGITEKEIAFKIEFYLKNKGLDLAFYPIVAVDENSSIPHYDTKDGNGIIKNNSVVLIDFGVKYQNYNSDITRMFFVNPDSEKINVYQKLLNIYEKIINFFIDFKPQSYKEVDLYSRELFKKNSLPFTPHSLGHGVGLEIHEYPKLSFLSEDKVENNHVFTIEPGVYFSSKWGARIEDTVFYENNNIKLLTSFGKDTFIKI